MISKEHLAKVRWHCRRGMLELDTLLENFFDRHYCQLSHQDQNSFEQLLEYTDQELYSWLMGQGRPEDMEMRKMVERIRQ